MTPISEAKLNANVANARFSTGPRTEEGKSKVSRNTVSNGLFANRDFVRPDETAIYKEFGESLFADLRPDGLLQHAHFVEILTATWRLRRCAALEHKMRDTAIESDLDPMENPETSKLQASIDRARSQAYGMLKRATVELERLQRNRAKEAETKQTHAERQKHTPSEAPDAQIARNSLCPCNSGQKYKRCCGRNAPGMVGPKTECPAYPNERAA